MCKLWPIVNTLKFFVLSDEQLVSSLLWNMHVESERSPCEKWKAQGIQELHMDDQRVLEAAKRKPSEAAAECV